MYQQTQSISCYYALTSVNNVAMNVSVEVSPRNADLFILNIYPQIRLLDYMKAQCFNFFEDLIAVVLIRTYTSFHIFRCPYCYCLLTKCLLSLDNYFLCPMLYIFFNVWSILCDVHTVSPALSVLICQLSGSI